MAKTTQQQRIVQYLKEKGEPASTYELIRELGIVDVRKRISELRNQGVAIKDNWIHGTNRYGDRYDAKEYYL